MGNPDGVPPPELLALQARFAADPRRELHTYAEDDDLASFAPRMVELHAGIRLAEHGHLRVLPIPGIKSSSALLPLACGLHRSRDDFRLVTPTPAYDAVRTWGADYLGAQHVAWPLRLQDGMRPNADVLERVLRERKIDRVDLVLVISPGNPAAVGMTRSQWKAIIERCLARGARLVNDAAYAGLAADGHASLASAAVEYPELEWLELYSVSKSFSDPGARLGALVGSRDFVADLEMIKGHADSGPVPYVMAAYGTYLEHTGPARAAMAGLRSTYSERVAYLRERLTHAGLRPACPTEAGFFSLWVVPRRVLGVDLLAEASALNVSMAEACNRVIARTTGIVGVHFEGAEPRPQALQLLRYAACVNVLDPAFQRRFEPWLHLLRPEYD